LAYKIEEENGRTLIGIEDLQGRVATERCVGDEWELHNELGTNVPEANGFIFFANASIKLSVNSMYGFFHIMVSLNNNLKITSKYSSSISLINLRNFNFFNK
jgi:hypothetical protein